LIIVKESPAAGGKKPEKCVKKSKKSEKFTKMRTKDAWQRAKEHSIDG